MPWTRSVHELWTTIDYANQARERLVEASIFQLIADLPTKVPGDKVRVPAHLSDLGDLLVHREQHAVVVVAGAAAQSTQRCEGGACTVHAQSHWAGAAAIDDASP